MNYLYVICLCFGLMGCQSAANQSLSSKSIETTPFDSSQYANIFKPWDGEWKGAFIVYEDTRGQVDEPVQPRELSKKMFEDLPLKENLTISVSQRYESTSPYYQTVNITDTYPAGPDSITVSQSSGYNQVTSEKIICVVNKPDEQVIHTGGDLGKGIISWQRHLSDPLKVEYFYETASDSFYTILGWGYYGGDDTTKAPKTWFYGQYTRQ